MTQKPRKPFQRIIALLIGISVGLVAIIFVNRTLYPEEHLEAEGSSAYRIRKMINEMNSVVPLIVADGTQFDSIFINPDNLLEYKYTLVNLQKDSVDISAFEQMYKPMLINNIRTKESMELIRTEQLTVIYSYYDKNGELLSGIVIKPDMYVQ